MLSTIASIGAFIPGLFGKQLSFKAAKIAGFASLAVLLLAVLSLGKCAYDASVVNEYKTEQRAKEAEATLEAERRANAEELARQLDEAARQGRLDAATAEAKRADPAGAAKPVGPVTKSYYDTLRKEQGK